MSQLTRVNRLGLVNWHLVQEDCGVTLIDTMLAHSAKAILAAARRPGARIVRAR